MRFPRSIRFRLSALYSAVAFGLGGVVLGLVYAAIRWQLTRQTQTRMIVRGRQLVLGEYTLVIDPRLEEAQVRTLESLFNQFVLDQLARYILLALVLLSVVSLVVGWVIAGRALAPVSNITEVAREIQASDLSRRIDLQGPDDELTRLASTFDGMLDRLERAFRSQRKFLADTSHDLRTPLSVIRSNVEVTLDDPATSLDEWRSTGEIVVRNATRMAAMIDGLLAAARFEGGQAAMVTVDLAVLVQLVAVDHSPSATAAGVSIEALAASAEVQGEPVALSRALTNLVDNAIRVSTPGGKLRIASGRTATGWSYLAVSDQGPGFDADKTRTGFGLSIVEQVVQLHNGAFRVQTEEGRGSTMIMWLPAGGEGEAPEVNPLPVL
jgi:signal transduction histidine kinase